MILRFKSTPPGAFLVQECDRDYCGRRTLHGPIARLRWAWADESRSTVRPVVGCDGCGAAFGGEFEMEAVAPGE